MEFNPTKFLKQEFIPRIEEVYLYSLYRWFDLSEEQVKDVEKWLSSTAEQQSILTESGKKPDCCKWTVRGVTGVELAKMIEAPVKQKNLDSIVEAMGNSKIQIDELKEVIGLGTDTPVDIIKRLTQLEIASVNPVVTMPVAVKLAEKFPIEFYHLTNKISALTGLGMDLKK